jgi:dTDP-4-amino-4,6-dideoxy-D-galactose acyltransferase
MDSYKILDWDSELFDFKVAAISQLKLDEKLLTDILNDLKSQNVGLVYWEPDARDSISCNAADRLNGLSVGVKRIYIAGLPNMEDQYKVNDANFTTLRDKAIREDLISLVLERAVHSRFYRDPEIRKSHYKALLMRWINSSIDDNTIFVTMDQQHLVGFVSLNEKDANGNIDFIVVDKQYAGKGIGKKLLSHSHYWLADKGYKNVQAVTQKENAVACKMYEKSGYSISEDRSSYHFWL